MVTAKKKLLIVSNNLVIGGVQKALINLLHEIKNTYDITLFVFSNSGEYKDLVPAQVKVLEGSLFLKFLGLSQAQTKSMGRLLYFARAILVLYTKIFGNHLPIRLLVSSQKKIGGFDVAISFLQNFREDVLAGGCNELILYRVQAPRKYTFLHCDFLNYGGNTPRNRGIYEQFDKIVAVSEGCRQSFIKAMPRLETRTYCVNNCQNYWEIISKANNIPIEYPRDCLNIITVARLSPEKGIIRALDIIGIIIGEGYNLRWYIVGDGPQKKEIEEKIYKSDLTEHVFLCGNQENPYRYMKNADILFLPSFHEAAPMVFAEAKCLGLTIITTKTTSASDMVAEGREGFICENSEYGIYVTLKNTLDNPKRLQECRKYLSMEHFTNEKALLQFHSLINERI